MRYRNIPERSVGMRDHPRACMGHGAAGGAASRLKWLRHGSKKEGT
jgi:hypothetical protein